MNFEERDEQLASTLKEAFAAGDPTPALQSKLNRKEVQQHMKERKQGSSPAKKGILILSFVGLAVLAVAAYKLLTNRPGEMAIQLIPADADMVATLDTNPSPEQVAPMSRIVAALNREGIADKFDSFINKGLQKSKLATDIQPYISKNFAFAGWKTGGVTDPPECVLFLATTNPGAVQGILQSEAQSTDQSGLFSVKSDTYLGVIGNYLVMSQNEARFQKILAVSKHQAPSVADNSQYQSARASLPSDSNLMFFMSPKMYFSQMGPKATNFAGDGWVASGSAIRNEGIMSYSHYPVKLSDKKGWEDLGSVAKLSPDALKEVPAGAYGVIGFSQVGQFIKSGYEATNTDQNLGPSLQSFERQSKLSVLNDVVPGLKGDAQIVVYPGLSGRPQDVDGVVVFDNANNATPTDLAQKIRDSLAHPASGGDGVQFDESKIGNVTVWKLNASMADKLKKSGGEVLKDKDLLILLANNNVLVTTSNGMATRIMQVYNNGAKTLADDAPFASMAALAAKDSQYSMMVSLSRVMNAFRSNIESSSFASKINPDDIIKMFGGDDTGAVGTLKYNGESVDGQFFLPVDWDKAIHVLGVTVNQNKAALDSTMQAGT